MNRGYSGGKRSREAGRDLRKKEKEERLRRNRELRAQGIDPDLQEEAVVADGGPALPEVKLEDVVISVAPRSRQGSFGPIKLFVGGLSSKTTRDDLQQAFGKFGNVVDVVVILDRMTGQSRGFGFVSYETANGADAAIKAMNGAELDGHTLKVNHAEARPSTRF